MAGIRVASCRGVDLIKKLACGNGQYAALVPNNRHFAQQRQALNLRDMNLLGLDFILHDARRQHRRPHAAQHRFLDRFIAAELEGDVQVVP